jgi:YesN/AraC family two-component response regulator
MAIRHGVREFLSKPLNVEELKSVLSMIISEFEQGKEELYK